MNRLPVAPAPLLWEGNTAERVPTNVVGSLESARRFIARRRGESNNQTDETDLTDPRKSQES
jgi:hypothetical protein